MRETGRKTPVDALPGDLLFFARVTDLMQGMGSRMRVRAPYLGIMAPFAKKALVDRHPPPATLIYPNASLSALEEKVRRLLSDLMHREQIVGCQVRSRSTLSETWSCEPAWTVPVRMPLRVPVLVKRQHRGAESLEAWPHALQSPQRRGETQ